MVRLACELADADAASLFWVEGQMLRPYIIYNLPKAYIAGIGEVPSNFIARADECGINDTHPNGNSPSREPLLLRF
jgi:hypothetical protein